MLFRSGLVVDLGCGSGILARGLCESGYSVLGVDVSPSMIKLARANAPRARFKIASLFDVEIPACIAVTSTGECINYLFGNAKNRSVKALFRRVFDAIERGGAFIFDVAEPGQVPKGQVVKSHLEGDGWAVLTEKSEAHGVLTRRIVTFRKSGQRYRRSQEVHTQRLYKSSEIATALRDVGFRVRVMRGYGSQPMLPARAAFLAKKP